MCADTNTAARQPFHVIIVAAGRGARMQSETPKQYLPLAGKMVLEHSISLFQSMPECGSIMVIINPDDAKSVHALRSRYNKIGFIQGGHARSDSVYNGLKALSHISDKDIVLIHDAARPCISRHMVRALVASLEAGYGATLALPVSDTLRKGDIQDSVIAGEQIPRDALWRIQTPQAFYYGDILKAHQNAGPETSATDDTALASQIGLKIKLVQGSEQNIKITYQQDIMMAENFLSARMETRTGLGFDVHAFDPESIGPVRLCGMDIDHAHALAGHSDADVGLHALTDALLGAIGQGDIGRHFPPSDMSFKNMDSAIFLEKAVRLLQEMGGTIINLDLTLICEAPKITPYSDMMRARVAEITGAPQNRINIKATTTERLGFTGRKEGIAAQALASVRIPCDNTGHD